MISVVVKLIEVLPPPSPRMNYAFTEMSVETRPVLENMRDIIGESSLLHVGQVLHDLYFCLFLLVRILRFDSRCRTIFVDISSQIFQHIGQLSQVVSILRNVTEQNINAYSEELIRPVLVKPLEAPDILDQEWVAGLLNQCLDDPLLLV